MASLLALPTGLDALGGVGHSHDPLRSLSHLLSSLLNALGSVAHRLGDGDHVVSSNIPEASYALASIRIMAGEEEEQYDCRRSSVERQGLEEQSWEFLRRSWP